jgi:hypothetical protein
MHRIKSKLVALVIVALLASLVPAASAAQLQNNWSTTQKIVYVGLTPKEEPDFWTAYEGETTTAVTEGDMLSYAKDTVADAITFWKQILLINATEQIDTIHFMWLASQK